MNDNNLSPNIGNNGPNNGIEPTQLNSPTTNPTSISPTTSPINPVVLPTQQTPTVINPSVPNALNSTTGPSNPVIAPPSVTPTQQISMTPTSAQNPYTTPQPNTLGVQTNQLQPISSTPVSSTPPSSQTMSGGMFGYQATPIPESKKKVSKKKRIVIIVLAALALIVGGLAIFYFTYWTKSDVVYSRAQRQMAKVLSSTINSEIKLFNDTEIDFEVTGESDYLPIIGKLNSRLLDSGSETNADVTYEKATINLGFMTTNNNDKTTGYYIKYKGIEQFYKSLISSYNSNVEDNGDSIYIDDDLFDPYINVLKKYDDKWISLDVFGLITGDEDANSETVTQDDVKAVTEKFIPIINDRFIGLDKDNAVLKTSNIRSDKVAGVQAWAYDLEIDNNKFNSMIDELIKAVDQINLSEQNKKLLKESLDDQKINSNEVDDYQYDYGISQETIQTYTIWLEKASAAPVKYSAKNSQLYDKKLFNSNETVVSLESISVSKITGSLKSESISYNYSDGKESSRSVLEAKFAVDNNSTNTSLTGTYDPSTKDENDLLTFKLGLKTNTNKAKIEVPSGAIDYQTIIDELNEVDLFEL